MIRLCRALPGSGSGVNRRVLGLRRFSDPPPLPTGLPADSAIHAGGAGDLSPTSDEHEIPTADPAKATKPSEPVIKTNTPFSSPKLESNPVNKPPNPTILHKRTLSTAVSLDNFSCGGIDGFPSEDSRSGGRDRERDRKEQEVDDKEYFRHHKASPLSEIEIADTRKPVTRATDGTADAKEESGAGGIVTWRPEQLVSADETLRRALETFKQNAMRGDPSSPHGRVLRELRGEWW